MPATTRLNAINSDKQGAAHACAIAAAILIQKAQSALDPGVGLADGVRFVEGSKTMPPPLPEAQPIRSPGTSSW